MKFFSFQRARKQFFLSLHLLLLLLFLCCLKSEAQIGISVSGGWNTTLPVFSVTEAGNDFNSTYLSAPNEVLIDVFKVSGSNSPFNWRVDVRKSDIDWGVGLQLSARRSGNGFAPNGSSFISGGTAFILLTHADQAFFNGRRDWYDIPIQFQLTGVSVLVPAKTHSTMVVYTVTEL